MITENQVKELGFKKNKYENIFILKTIIGIFLPSGVFYLVDNQTSYIHLENLKSAIKELVIEVIKNADNTLSFEFIRELLLEYETRNNNNYMATKSIKLIEVQINQFLESNYKNLKYVKK